MCDEELSDSPLFSLFLSSPHYTVAAAQQLIVAVPSAASMALLGRPGRELLESHVLRKSPYYQHQYVTLSGKAVALLGAQLQCVSGFAEPRTVAVVGEETYYDDGYASFQVLRISMPLEGRVPPAVLRELQEADGGDVRALERRSVEQWELLLSRATGDAVLPLLSPVPGAASSVFASMARFVHQFNTSYVLVKGFIDHAGAKVADAVARMRDEAMSKARSVNREWAARSRSLLEVHMAVESAVMAAIYRKLFAGLCELYAREEDAMERRALAMRDLSMAQLGVREDAVCQPHVAMALMAQLPTVPTVQLKLVQLEDVSRALTQAVKEQTAASVSTAAAQADDASAEDGGGERRKRDTVLSAEDMIPLTLYVVLHSRLQHVQAHLQLLHHFPPCKQVGGLEHLQVPLANFQAACQIIDSGRTGMEGVEGVEGAESVDGDGVKRPHGAAYEGKESLTPAAVDGVWSSSTSVASVALSSAGGRGRKLSSSSSLGSLSSTLRNRSPSSSPHPPMIRGAAVRSDDDSPHPVGGVPRPPRSRPASARGTVHGGGVSGDEDDGSEALGNRRPRSRSQRRPATLPAPLSNGHAAVGSYPPPSSSASSSPLSRTANPSTNPFDFFDTPEKDALSDPFSLPRALPRPPLPSAAGRSSHATSRGRVVEGRLSSAAASSASSSRTARRESSGRGRAAAEGVVLGEESSGLGDFLSRLKRSDDVVTGSLRATQQR